MINAPNYPHGNKGIRFQFAVVTFSKEPRNHIYTAVLVPGGLYSLVSLS